MNIGLIGLGKMGYPLALNFIDNNIDIHVYSSNQEKINQLANFGVSGFSNIKEFIENIEHPKVIWLMIPSGQPVDDMINRIKINLKKGDIIIDGGNSNYKDSIRRYTLLKEDGIEFLDVGTSGGIEGARNGACLMIGGDRETYAKLEEVFKRISGGSGYGLVGSAGAGHYVKMIHNAIEYGMMQAIGEGFQMLYQSNYKISLEKVSNIWSKGSIISGLLIDKTSDALSKDEELSNVEGVVNFSGEADWALDEALSLKVSVPVIAAALFARYKSKDDTLYSEKLLSAMRNEFGGHSIVYKK
ncbi:MAG: phosphogluconate dehydrogenase (NAD(+)-dependent, decarboxylating) [Proteocatella sp.]